jgi:hypothetical protein
MANPETGKLNGLYEQAEFAIFEGMTDQPPIILPPFFLQDRIRVCAGRRSIPGLRNHQRMTPGYANSLETYQETLRSGGTPGLHAHYL